MNKLHDCEGMGFEEWCRDIKQTFDGYYISNDKPRGVYDNRDKVAKTEFKWIKMYMTGEGWDHIEIPRSTRSKEYYEGLRKYAEGSSMSADC